jgi:predicted MFS family arabinose efflux permease
VPSFAVMAFGVALIPLADDFTTLMLAGLVVGFGNGLGSGTMMTLGADLVAFLVRETRQSPLIAES